MKDSTEESHPFLETAEDGPRARWRAAPLKFSRAPLPSYTHFLSHTITIIITSLIWGLITYIHLHSNSRRADFSTGHPDAHTYDRNSSFVNPATDTFIDCGSRTTQEYQANGCEYDILMNAWLPSQCIDRGSILSYQEEDDESWQGYADAARTELIPYAELGGYAMYYTSARDHTVHCLMMWKRQFRAFSEGWRYVDRGTTVANHTDHCVEFLLRNTERPGDRDVPLKVFPSPGGCYERR
ncbi:hypothetical protein F4778DRAFT_734718 [Xylariomycetidae sp. FL2044]|nr:hypothetical protein F4778DRAFT_734718 [Xylariomycetidae sp. FL2044]